MTMQFQTVRADDGRSYNFVNFGYSEDSNTWFHEQDILSFANGLFDPKSTHILSASGPNAKFVDNDGNGNFLRRPDGSLELKNSTWAAKTTRASRANYMEMYSRIATEPGDSALVVIGDHGSDTGLNGWTDDVTQGGEFISPASHFEALAKIPVTKTVQSIYLQCFAGTMLVDQTRVIPAATSELGAYADKYYPMNRCGLALSRHNEMGQYNTNNKDWSRSVWTDYFKSMNPVTLTGIQERLNRDIDLAPTTVLTSDYLAEDILKIACQEKVRKELEACVPTGPTAQLHLASAQTLAQVCNLDDVNKDLEEKVKATQNAFMGHWMPMMYKSYWTEEYIKETDPQLADTMVKNQKINYNNWQVLSGNLSEDEKARLNKETEELMKDVPAGFMVTLMKKHAEVAATPAFDQYYDRKCNLEFMKSEVAYKLIHESMNEYRVPATQKTCREEGRHLFSRFRGIQKVRKEAELRALTLKRNLVDSLLDRNPSLKSLKDRYENIKKCENDSLK